MICLKDVSYRYPETGEKKRYALKNINLKIEKGEFLFIVGHTGSGKSTLAQLLNALERPFAGKVFYEDKDIWGRGFSRKELRSKVGLVFQYPEHQLFADTVLEDVSYGPNNQGLSGEELEKRVKKALRDVHIDEKIWDKSPFELSGGQQRKVAIAGILAMDPDYIVLDEPTAGLDPLGRTEILELLKRLQLEKNVAIILISHRMDDVAKYGTRVVVLNQGQLLFDLPPEELFANEKELEAIGLSIPGNVRILHKLQKEKIEKEKRHGRYYDWSVL